MLALLVAGCTGLYVCLALAAVAVLRRTAPPEPEALPDTLPAEPPFVSVLVAARNEETHLPACLETLLAQDYPPDRFEVVVADDGSTDATAAVVARYAAADARVRLVAVPAADGRLRGKARALHAAVEAARGDVLLVTDADCTPPPGWVRRLSARLRAPGTGVVCGVTTVRHATLVDRIQALDWLLLLTVAAAASAAGVPLTAMGNNMGLRRRAYEAVGGYPALPFSVTEDYALFRAVHAAGWRVGLHLDAALRNVTEPLPTLRDVFRQRRRWARGGLAASPRVYAFYACIYGCHAGLVAGLVAMPALALPLLACKLAADLVVLRAGMRRTGESGRLRSFLPFECYLFAYLTVLPLTLLAQPRTRWKGRTY